MDLQTTICVKMYVMKDRDLANILHRLESSLYRDSIKIEQIKYVHQIFASMKKNNKTTRGRARNLVYAMETLEELMDAHDVNEYTNYVMEKTYSLLT